MKKFISIALLAATVAACSSQGSDTEATATDDSGFTRDTIEQPTGEFSQIAEEPEKAADAVQSEAAANQSSSTHSSATHTSTTGTQQTTTAAETKKKKTLSNPVKGALIGTGAGIITGAVVDKKHRGQGAIIGGILGAAAGATTGTVIDQRQKNK